jgi:ABC-type transporter Mla maintaining outer membrane lipid asymmetry permease subunit MlaE
MGKRLLIGLVGGVLGYLVGDVGGGFLLSLLSSNTHDRSVEAAMTGAFVFGPIGAVLGCIAGIRRKRAAPSAGGAV